MAYATVDAQGLDCNTNLKRAHACVCNIRRPKNVWKYVPRLWIINWTGLERRERACSSRVRRERYIFWVRAQG